MTIFLKGDLGDFSKLNGVFWDLGKFSYTLGVAPSLDSSDHQDDITFLIGNPYNPSFTTVTVRGPYLTYTPQKLTDRPWKVTWPQ